MADEKKDTPKAEAKTKGDYIKVVSAENGVVALHEIDPQHPTKKTDSTEAGEVFVAYNDDKTPPVEVFRTAAVNKALAEGRLIEVK